MDQQQQEPAAQVDHEFDLEVTDEELELFAEELSGEHQRHTLGGNTLSTLGCECGLSTFLCLF